jgi:TrmH family RNA methyltransferase
MKYINSKDNKLFKEYQRLTRRKYRELTGKYLIEGKRLVDDALQKGIKVEAILLEMMHEEYFGAYPDDILITMESNCFSALSDTVNSQGIVAVINKDVAENLDLAEPILILDRLQDPGNVGTIIRTAVAAGIHQIALVKGTVDIYNPKVIRSTAGAIFSAKFIHINNLSEFSQKLKHESYAVIGTALENAIPCDEVAFPYKSAVIIGNEGNGIEEYVLNNTDFNITITLHGEVESLNASIAAGIVLYEWGKQLNK